MPRKPTVLKILEGNCGHRPLNKAEPVPRDVRPRCPAHLDGEAKKEWRRISDELAAMGLLAACDRAALAAYCVEYARWVEAETNLKRTGLVLKSGDGMYYQNPFLAVVNKALLLMHRYLIEFGLTPSSRSRLQVADRSKGSGVPKRERKTC